MKRFFALLLVLVLLLCACDANEKEPKIARAPTQYDDSYIDAVVGGDMEESEAQQEEEETEEEPPAPITPDFEPLRHTVCAGAGMTAVRNDDGTVSSNWMENKTDAVNINSEWTQWSDITDLSIFCESMLALRSDGTVEYCGGRTDEKWWTTYTFAHEISTWKNVVQISAGIFDFAALMADGSIRVAGSFPASAMTETKGFTQISMGDCFLGLRRDGTVYCYSPNSEFSFNTTSWENVTQVSAGWDHAVALRADGTVVAAGNNEEGQCNVDAWHDIVQVCAGRQHTIGLCADGTVVTTGLDYYGELDLGDWTDIVEIDGRYNHTVGKKSDGTLVFDGTESAFLTTEEAAE